MQAVQVMRFGGPEVLEAVELPGPVAGVGQLVVDVVAAEVLFLDTQLRSGWGREYFAMTPPFTPGAGVAGTVRSVGDAVDPALVGRRVIAGTGGIGTYEGGGYAQQAAVPADEVHRIPDGLELHTALAALHDGPTALGQLELAAVRPDEHVLVNAAAGSLGSWLLPLLSAAGAVVIAAARGERKLAHARNLGADLAVDYSQDDWTDRVREATGDTGVDVVFDAAGGKVGRAAFDITAPGGRFLSYGAASGGFAEIDPDQPGERQITVIGIYRPSSTDSHRLTEQALSQLATGHIRPVVGQTFRLGHAADAHAAIEARTTIGKTLLLP